MKLQEFPESKWLNTDKVFTVEELKGQVVLLNFFTYCCINSIHTFPEINYLQEKYSELPFTVIGIHCAKFDNERDVENVRSAIFRHEINFPVIIDNEFLIWKKYNIRSWPTFLLVGSDGQILGKASGEGNLDVLEQSIQLALKQGQENGTLAKKRVEFKTDEFKDDTLKFPSKIHIDKDNKHLYISDTGHNRILKVKFENAVKGKIIQEIGTKEPGNELGKIEDAKFNKPQGIYYDDGILYICDTENHSIKTVDFENDKVDNLLGSGRKARWGDTRGESLNSPWDILKNEENIFIAMAGTHQIWRMDINTEKIRPFIGNGRENLVDGNSRKSQLAQPSGLADDGRDLFFADSESSAVRKVNMNSGLVKTISGKGLNKYGFTDGRIEEAMFQHPKGLYFENNILYVADTFNNSIRIINQNKKVVQTLITDKNKKLCTLDESAEGKYLNEPNDVMRFGNYLYIADTNNNCIKALDIKKRILYKFAIEK